MIRNTKIAVPSKSLPRERWRDFLEVVFLVVILAIFIRSFILGVYRISTDSMAPALVTGDFIWASKIAYGIKIPFSSYKLLKKIPEKGDVVVVQFLSSSYSAKKIMRVIAHPGDHVEFKDHQLWVNGQTLITDSGKENLKDQNTDHRALESTNQQKMNATAIEDHSLNTILKLERNGEANYLVQTLLAPTQSRRLIPLVVPPGEVFVMLDNRAEFISEIETSIDKSSLWSLIPVEQIESQVRGIWFSLAWPTTIFNPAFNSSNASDVSGARLRWERLGILSNK